MRFMFCHVNNIFLVSQPYSHSNYKEIPPIYWMTLVYTYYSGSVWMSILTFFIFRLTFMVEFWFTSLLVVFLLLIVYMATTSYNLCTRQR